MKWAGVNVTLLFYECYRAFDQIGVDLTRSFRGNRTLLSFMCCYTCAEDWSDLSVSPLFLKH